jgi:hypothetical protein
MSDQAAAAYDGLTTHLLADPDDDVDVTPDGLLVKGKLFAFLDGEDLVVELSAIRAADLVAREQARPFIGSSGEPSATWLRVSDWELWFELGSEAHAFVGEPPVGRQS